MRSSRMDMIALSIRPWVRKGYASANTAYLVQNIVRYRSAARVTRRHSAVRRLEKLRKEYIPSGKILDTIEELDNAIIYVRT